MLNEDAPSYQYRPGYNPQFLRRVMAKRKEEARQTALANEAAEREARRLAEEQLREARRAAAQAAREERAVEEYRVIDLSKGSGKMPARTIIEHVSVAAGIPYAEIVGASRHRPIARARMTAMYEVRKLRPDLSLPQIAKIFRRDHTTVLYAIRRAEAEIAKQEGQPR